MKKILLVTEKVMHYRSRIYNHFYDLFQQQGYEFHVLSDEYQSVDCPIRYRQHRCALKLGEVTRKVSEIQPDVVITFIGLRVGIIFRFLRWCRRRSLPLIYWGHGMNLSNASSPLWRWVNHRLHRQYDALILYSPAQLNLIDASCRNRTFIAMNTLDFSDVDKNAMRSPDEVKAFYGIKESRIVMYISRIMPRKGLDILLRLFRNEPDVALVVVGGGATPEQLQVMQETPNFYYLGEKYGVEVDEIYQLKGVFSTPGHIGLAINQAMYWGKPVVELPGPHAPEICYLHNGENGFIEETEEALKNRIMQLLTDEELYQRVSSAARATYEKEMPIETMFEGFMQAVQYVESKKKKK